MDSNDRANRGSISSTTSSLSWTSKSDPADWIAPADHPSWDAPTIEHGRVHSSGGEHGKEEDYREENNCTGRPSTSASGDGEGGQGKRQRRLLSAFEADSATELWAKMVEVQQRFGCYRSARMRAVASAERAAELMPSKACLDLLNDDITDDELPEEGWKILGRFVVEEAEEPTGQAALRWKMWGRKS